MMSCVDDVISSVRKINTSGVYLFEAYHFITVDVGWVKSNVRPRPRPRPRNPTKAIAVFTLKQSNT